MRKRQQPAVVLDVYVARWCKRLIVSTMLA
jgi:hypothetical protein